MVQFNLLPDVKLQFIKARRTKYMMTLVSIVIIVVSLFGLVLAFLTVDVFQKHTLSGLNTKITSSTKQLKSTKDLNKILTVQNQLSTLTTLHASKATGSRMFGYLAQITPKDATITNLNIDFTQTGDISAGATGSATGETITLTGEAPSLSVVNQFTDTMKATTYNGGDTKNAKAFSNVVLSAFGRDDTKATYTITAQFSPDLFDTTKTITLSVPAGPTADPATLFQKSGGAL